jgi:hypothetical protein
VSVRKANRIRLFREIVVVYRDQLKEGIEWTNASIPNDTAQH